MVRINVFVLVAMQPGYFEYYKASDEVVSIENQKVLNSLARAVQKVHREIEQINEEIAQRYASAPKPVIAEVPLTALQQWFDVYGRPKNPDGGNPELITTFKQSSKTYGGTGHHRSFKSVSSVMTKGRITR